MSKTGDQRPKRKMPWVIGTLTVVSLAVLLILQSSNIWKSLTIERSSDFVLLYALSSLNFVAFIVFAFIFLRSIVKLVRERRTFQTGAKLKTRLLIYFFAVSLMPIIAMAVFSYLFLNRALDRWFAQIPRQGTEQTRVIGETNGDAPRIEVERLGEQQTTIRRTAMFSLGLLTFLLIFASMWIAFYLARGLTTPIKALAEGAGEIAAGNLGHRVDVLAEDELGILVSAFNEMSANLEANSRALNEGREYIETVLETLPTGVVTFGRDGSITTMNKAASRILGDGLSGDIEKSPERDSIDRLVARAFRTGHSADQITLHSKNGNSASAERTVALTASSLPDESGVVLVIEDLSELIAAQRSSAWQEVARRMAHEIKNPLTPIQLSAERIARRFDKTGHVERGSGKRIDDKGPIGDVVQESTETILREVSSLKSLVDEFSRFARLPETKLEKGDAAAVAADAVATFEGRQGDVAIALHAGEMPAVMIDAEGLKRVFINLIENSIEALDGIDGKTVSVSLRHDEAREILTAEVADNGKGIPSGDLQKLFQPYFSTKGRGTGLGLAIVSRIVADHHGKIYVSKNLPRGAKFTIELPVQNQ